MGPCKLGDDPTPNGDWELTFKPGAGRSTEGVQPHNVMLVRVGPALNSLSYQHFFRHLATALYVHEAALFPAAPG